MSGAPLAAGVSRRASPLERRAGRGGLCRDHGPVGGQLRGREVHDPGPHPGRLRVPPVRARRASSCSSICLWREGSIRIPRRDILPLAGLGFIGFGLYQMLWSTALASTSVGQLGAPHRRDARVHGPHRAARSGVDRLDRIKVRRRRRSRSPAWRSCRRATGCVRECRPRRPPDPRRGGRLGLLREPRGRRAASLQRPPGDLLDGRVRGAVPRAGRPLAALERRLRRRSAPAQIGAILYSGLLSSAVGNVVVFWGISLLGPTRITNLQFLPPALAIVFAAIFLGDPILVSQVVGGARHRGRRPHRPTEPGAPAGAMTA